MELDGVVEKWIAEGHDYLIYECSIHGEFRASLDDDAPECPACQDQCDDDE